MATRESGSEMMTTTGSGSEKKEFLMKKNA